MIQSTKTGSTLQTIQARESLKPVSSYAQTLFSCGKTKTDTPNIGRSIGLDNKHEIKQIYVSGVQNSH